MAYITKKTTQHGVKPIGSNLFGLCSTASSTAQKSVSMSDFNVLVSGVTIHVYFAYANTAQNPTLAVGSTAGVAIKRNGILGGKWSSGSVISFTYDGTNWIQNDADEGGVTYGLSLNGNQLSLVEGGTEQSVILTDEDTTYSLSINGNVLTLTDSDGNHDDVTLPSGTDTTYTISISGHTLTLTPSSGTPQSVTLPDNDTKYGLSLNGNTISLVEGGSSQSITITDENTTYTISISGRTLTLTPSEGTAQTITLPDNNTTYTLTQSGDDITLTGSDGSTYTVTVQGGTTLLYTKDVADTATSTNNVVQNNVDNNVASGGYALAEGDFTRASGYASHAEGSGSIASGSRSHAEGSASLAGGRASHAEGNGTIAIGENSHVEGDGTQADGVNAHASGLNTLAQRANQTVIGKNNIADTDGTTGADLGKYAFIIGNGAADDSRSNAFTVDWNGNVDIASGAKYKIGGNDLSASDVGAVPTTRTVNNKALSADISLDASDVGAVPTTRTVNGKALTADISDADYVTNIGTSGSWRYRKWNSGRVEAWASLTLTAKTPSVWVSPIRYMDTTVTIPSGIFSSRPNIIATSPTNQMWVVSANASGATSISVRFATVASSSLTMYIEIYARQN